ncbi:MAG: DUF3440 domain-containing protein [Actinobacteria bacterium]|nr:DUF3440 domain-containing protein [Actinomycetota bacterium]
MMEIRKLHMNVLDAARQRIAFCFDQAERVYVSFSGGKDSTVLLHLAGEEARARGRRLGVLFIDLEGQYKLTIDHVAACYRLYADVAEPYWVALPMSLRNAVSQFAPRWVCWDAEQEDRWIRRPPADAITDPGRWPWFRPGMEFEDFVIAFGRWYSQGQRTFCLVGIRADESLNRWRSVATTEKGCYRNRAWTTRKGDRLYNAYPIYDWRTRDIWIYNARSGRLYNRLYDRMHQAGLSIHQQRICQPYGDDQRKGLWLFHVIEPETWSRVVARVAGANQGALYAQETGNILGNIKITKPDGHTWESFSKLLLASMPAPTAEHYRNKIAVFLRWYQDRGYMAGIPDDGPLDKSKPSWKRVCKALLRNDYWCKGLSFSQHKTPASLLAYYKMLRRRREEWQLI